MRGIDSDAALEKLTLDSPDLPKICVHGTYIRHVQAILQNGLKPGGLEGNRTHIHFTPFAPGDKEVISGMRYDAEVAVYVNIRAAQLDNIPFYISVNKVILTPGVDNGIIVAKYFDTIEDIRN